jgi:general stress protein YciG
MRASLRVHDPSCHHKHHVVPLHEDPESTFTVPLTVKEHSLIHGLRYKITKTLGNFFAWKMLKGLDKCVLMHEYARLGGRIGGAVTRRNKRGIFSDDWDRSFQSKLNAANGIAGFSTFDPEFLSEVCRKGGLTTKENKSGIFREDIQHLRTEWAKAAAKELHKNNKGKGCATKEWILSNPTLQLKNASKGGKQGGKVVGSMLWWNNGSINKKANDCPGEGWNRGMLMSDKKKEQVYNKLAGHNRKV